MNQVKIQKEDIIAVREACNFEKIPFLFPQKKKVSPTNLKDKRLVNTANLMELLDCGKSTAIKIGNRAGAKVCIGRKLLWNVKLIQQYLDNIAE